MRKTKKFLTLKMLIIATLIFMIATPVFSANQTVRVWVEYKGGQGTMVRNVLKGAGAQIHYQFDHLNSFVVTIPKGELDSLARNPHVASIEVDAERSLIEPKRMTIQDLPDPNNLGQTIPFGIDAVQARDVWDSNRDGVIDAGAPTGEGRVVCIIDTGYYSGHEDLSGVDLVGGLSQVDDNWTEDGYGHGTHVAGTVSAMNNDLGVVGVTPGTVSFYIVKIFQNDGSWLSKAHASDLVAAIYDCADNGANIVSMSLGGFNHQPKERAAFADLYEQGILFVASASNDGHRTYSYPASYDSVISVGAIDEANVVADFSNFNDQVELTAPGVNVLSTVPFLDLSTLTVDGEGFDGFHLEYAAWGEASGDLADGGLCDSTSNAWNKKVVLCERGDISFYDKVMNVQNSGGTAAVIYNNLPGGFLGTLGAEGDYIVAISLSQEDGQLLVADKLGEFGEVSSELFWPDNGYEAWGGTSMAAPHVSGVAALVWSAYPNRTNVKVREALDATAFDLGNPGRDVYYGFGLVQAYDALEYLSGPGKGPKGP